MRKLSTTFKELCSEKMFWFLSIYLIAWILLLIWAFLGSHAQGQAIDNVTVSGTIVDSDSVTWTNGTWKAQLQNPRGGIVTYIDTGVPVTTQFSGVLNSSGAFSQAGVPNNSALAPAGTSWVFTFCPDASFQCTSLPNLAFSSGQSTYNISSLATSNIVAPRFPALGHQSWGYIDGEISPTPNVGGIYFNVTSSELRYWNGVEWTPITKSSVTTANKYQFAGFDSSSLLSGVSDFYNFDSVSLPITPVTMLNSVNATTGQVIVTVANSFPTGGGTQLYLNLKAVENGPCYYTAELPIVTTAATSTTITYIDSGIIGAGNFGTCVNIPVANDYIETPLQTATSISEDANSIVTITMPDTSSLVLGKGSQLFLGNLPATFSYLQTGIFSSFTNQPWVNPITITPTTITFLDTTYHGTQAQATGTIAVYSKPISLSLYATNRASWLLPSGLDINTDGGVYILSGPTQRGSQAFTVAQAQNQTSRGIGASMNVYQQDGSADSDFLLGYDSGRGNYYVRMDANDYTHNELARLSGSPADGWWFGIPAGKGMKFSYNYSVNDADLGLDGSLLVPGSEVVQSWVPTNGKIGVLAGTLTPGDFPKIDPTGQWLVDSGTSFLNNGSSPAYAHNYLTPTTVSSDGSTFTITANNSLTNGEYIMYSALRSSAPCNYDFSSQPNNFNVIPIATATATTFTFTSAQGWPPIPASCTSSSVTNSLIWTQDGTTTSIQESTVHVFTIVTSAVLNVQIGDELVLPSLPSPYNFLNGWSLVVTNVSGTTIIAVDYGFTNSSTEPLTSAVSPLFVVDHRGPVTNSEGFRVATDGPINIGSWALQGQKEGQQQVFINVAGPVDKSNVAGTGSNGPSYQMTVKDSNNPSSGSVNQTDWFRNGGYEHLVTVVDATDDKGVQVALNAYPSQTRMQVALSTGGTLTVQSGYNPNSGTTAGSTSFNFDQIISGNFTVNVPPTSGQLGILSGTLTPGDAVKIDPTGKFLIDATVPHMTWTGNVGGQTYAATTTDIGANVWQTSSAITITRLDLHVGAAASSCTTYPVVGVYDSTTSSFVATTTLTNGAFSIFNATNANVAAGDQLRLGIQTAAAGCTVASSSLWWTMEYKMQ